MALSATFTANFSSFFDAVEKAEVKLKDFGGGADKAGARLERMAQSFSGQKIIQEASLMAKAIGDVENYSKLTEKELARVGATAAEAVEKLKALGKEVPKNIQQMADATKGANKETTDWLGTISKVAGAVGIAFSVGAITNFVGSVFAAASAVKDLSEQWGVSTKAAQQWSKEAEAGGVSAEKVGKSIQFMSGKLVDASKEYDALLSAIGLSGDKLRAMSDEDAWREMVTALGDVKDQAQRLDYTIALLGPSAKNMAGMMGDAFLDAADKQNVMADETIRRLADAESAWKSYKDTVVVVTAEMMSAAIQGTKIITKTWGNTGTFIGLTLKDITTAIVSGGRVVKDTAGDWLAAQRATEDWNRALQDTTRDVRLSAAATDDQNDGLKTTAQVLADVKGKDEAARAATAERTQAVKDAEKAQEALTQKLDAYNKANDDYLKKIRDLAAAFKGADLTGKAWEYVAALQASIPVQEMTRARQDDINKVMRDAIAVYEAAGERVPAILREIAAATTAIPEFMPKVNAKALDDIVQRLGKGVELKAPDTKGYKAFADSVADVAEAFATLGNITGGTMGDIGGDIATVIGAMNVAQTSASTFGSGLANIKAGNISSGIGQLATGALGVAAAFQSATKETGKLQSTISGAAIGFQLAGPWGAAAGAVAGFVKGLFNARKEAKEVAKTRNDFLTAAGGIEEMTRAASNANVSLTNLFAAKNKDDLKAAFTEIQAALEYQEQAMGTLAETTARYGFTIEELGPAMQRQELDKQAQQLFKDWEVLNSAGIDTVAITEKMADSVNDYVNQAVAMGFEIPAAMRPMLEAFMRSGTLIDENGNAITDLEEAGVSFAMTMSEGFQALIKEVEKLTDVISRSLSDAIENVPEPKRIGWNWDVQWNIPDPPKAGGLPAYQQGTGGFRNFGKGTPVMLHGWEAVVPRDEARASMATVAGGGAPAPAAAGEMRIVLQQDGKTTAEWLLPFIPGAARRLGLAGVY